MTIILPALSHLRVGLTDGGQTSNLQIANAVQARPQYVQPRFNLVLSVVHGRSEVGRELWLDVEWNPLRYTATK